MKLRLCAVVLSAIALPVACQRSNHHSGGPAGDPPEVTAGERLFLESRFAQFFAVNGAADVNAALAAGDPALDLLQHADGSQFTGPFAGGGMNCRNCHLVDEMDGVAGAGIRTYADFAARSPIPARADGRTLTPRNSPPLVNASIERDDAFFFHLDGEFATLESLVRATMTGRNYGWMADEGATALAHIARVVREDDGTGTLAADFGGVSYADLFASGKGVPKAMRLPANLRLDVATATDDEIVDAVAFLVARYVEGIEFERDKDGAFTGSPWDLFLRRNGLPLQPDVGEGNEAFTARQGAALLALASPQFVTPADGAFVHHGQPFQFGATELAGAAIFFAKPATLPASGGEIAAGGIGNCTACHYGPSFTDFQFHNVGISQAEYDTVHGAGGFAALTIPDLATRGGDTHQFLPPNAGDATAEGVFMAIPDVGDARLTDLGVWNVLANANVPGPQAALHDLVAALNGLDPLVATDAQLLDLAIAIFKTPGLRDLADGGPYMHSGAFATIEEVLAHYEAFSDLARASDVRNGDVELTGIALVPADEAPLAAFLRSLTHDYD